MRLDERFPAASSILLYVPVFCAVWQFHCNVITFPRILYLLFRVIAMVLERVIENNPPQAWGYVQKIIDLLSWPDVVGGWNERTRYVNFIVAFELFSQCRYCENVERENNDGGGKGS